MGPINSDGHAIGLDIGATSVRAAILTPGTVDGRPAVTMNEAGQLPLPDGVIVNGVVTDADALTATLKQLWQANKFSCDHVILGVANPQVLVRDLTLPNLSPQQRAKALPFQAREIVALPIDQVTLDFVTLGDPDPTTNQVAGLLIATPREPVLTAVQAVEAAGLKVARVDLSSFALLRAIADGHLSVEAVVDFGAHLTTIVIHEQGVPKLVRTLARGGQELTERLADRLSVGREEAESAKCDVGLTGQSKIASTALAESIRPLLAEIRSSINYFRTANDGAQIERISLTGGGAKLPGLTDILSTQNNSPAEVIQPMQHINNAHGSHEAWTDQTNLSASAVALGLAMGAAA